jgi:hypothetical protein
MPICGGRWSIQETDLGCQSKELANYIARGSRGKMTILVKDRFAPLSWSQAQKLYGFVEVEQGY